MPGSRVLLPFDLAAAIAVAGSLWPAPLMAREAVAEAGAAAAGMPPMFHWCILEGRLTGDEIGRVDLLAAIVDVPGARAAVLRALDGALPARLESVRPVLARWGQAADPRVADMHVLWFEWDAPFVRTTPLTFLTMDRTFWGPGGRLPTLDEQVEMAVAAFATSYGETRSAASLARVRAALAAVPTDGRAMSSASLRARGVERDRIFVGMPRGRVARWLAQIGWSGDAGELERWLTQLVAPGELAFVQVELGAAGVSPRIGIEAPQTEDGTPGVAARRRFLDWLAAEGVTTPARANGVRHWIGSRERRDVVGRERRSLHIKCLLGAGEAPAVKAYLGVHLGPSISR